MKKTIKLLIYIIAAVIFAAIPLAACSEGNSGDYAVPVYEDDAVITIGAWVPYIGDGTQARYDEIAAAGFTVLFNIHDQLNWTNPEASNYVLNYLNGADAAGMKAVLYDEAMYGVDAGLNDQYAHLYMGHPALIGSNLKDEPSKINFTNLAVKQSLYKERYPDKLGFINLFPDVGGTTLGAPDFTDYLISYMETVQPELLSYDNYVLLEDGSVKDSFFSDMAKVRYIAKEYGVPAHNFFLAVGHKAGPFRYRQPNEAEFRWQMACDLAYGYSGFTYYCYWEGRDINYEECIISKKGKKTDLYYYAQAVNLEMLAWDHVYLNFDWQGTALVKGSQSFANVLFMSVSEEDKVTAAGGVKSVVSTRDALFGMFTDGNNNKGFMVTNATNPFDNLDNTVTVEFESKYKGVMIYGKDVCQSGEPEILPLKKGKVTIELEPGEGKFLIPLVNK